MVETGEKPTDGKGYRLYYGTSADGRGYPLKISTVFSIVEADTHLRKIEQNPYSFGHVMIDCADGTEIRYKKGN
jgi:hypothetical protein